MVFRKTFGVTQITRKNDVMLFKVSALRLPLIKSFLNYLFDDSKKKSCFLPQYPPTNGLFKQMTTTAFPHLSRKKKKKREREKGENRPLVKSKLERKRTGEEGDSWGRVSVLSSIRRYGKTYVMASYFLRMMMWRRLTWSVNRATYLYPDRKKMQNYQT